MSAFEHLPRALRSLRISRRLTQRGLARAAGISRSHLSKFERGVARPPLPTLDKLLIVLDADATEFFHAMVAAGGTPRATPHSRYRAPERLESPDGRPEATLAGFQFLLESMARETALRAAERRSES